MERLNLVQGEANWHAARRDCDGTASEAPAMMGENPNKKRSDLLAEKKSGVEKEFSDYTKDVVFAKGHEVEAFMRPTAEKIIGEELFPTTGRATIEGLVLLASFDGIDMMASSPWECKQGNKAKIAQVNDGVMPECDKWQVVQQCLISASKKCLYMVADVDVDVEPHEIKQVAYMWFTPTDQDYADLIAGWKQFNKDLEAFVVPEEKIQVVAVKKENLPALFVQVKGEISVDNNLQEFSNALTQYVKDINHEPKTDQDFAELESSIKVLKKAEAAADTAETNALSQTASISSMCSLVADIRKLARTNRLLAEKTVKTQKTVVKQNIVNEAQTEFNNHMEALSKELQGLPTNVTCDFSASIKNKRTFDSMRDAAQTALAQGKIESDRIALIMRNNLAVLKDKAAEHRFLFNDLQEIIHKPTDDFTLVVASRIGEHQKAEQEKLDALKAQAVIDAQKIVDDKKAQDEREAANKVALELAESTKKSVEAIKKEEPVNVTPQKEVVAQSDTGNETVSTGVDNDAQKIANYINAITSIETPILGSIVLQEALNENALMIADAVNNLCKAIAQSKAA